MVKIQTLKELWHRAYLHVEKAQLPDTPSIGTVHTCAQLKAPFTAASVHVHLCSKVLWRANEWARFPHTFLYLQSLLHTASLGHPSFVRNAGAKDAGNPASLAHDTEGQGREAACSDLHKQWRATVRPGLRLQIPTREARSISHSLAHLTSWMHLTSRVDCAPFSPLVCHC